MRWIAVGVMAAASCGCAPTPVSVTYDEDERRVQKEVKARRDKEALRLEREYRRKKYEEEAKMRADRQEAIMLADESRRKAKMKAEKEEILRQQLDRYIDGYPSLPDNVRDALRRREPCIGIPQEAFRIMRGPPWHVRTMTTATGVHEQWTYGDTYYYFDNGILTAWQN